MVTITGNKIGCPAASGYQRYGVQANTGSDQYVVTGNSLVYNWLGAWSGSSGTSSKIITNNVQ